jgi:hypothetical protein
MRISNWGDWGFRFENAIQLNPYSKFKICNYLQSPLRNSKFLLTSQCHHWIDPGRATSWNVARQ